MRLVAYFGRVPPLPPGLKAVRESAETMICAEFDRPSTGSPRGHRLRMPLVIYRLEAIR